MSGFSFGSAIIEPVSVGQLRGAVNEILIVQIARVKRGFHADAGKFHAVGFDAKIFPAILLGFSAKRCLASSVLKIFQNLD
jgi:hypothetical protein